MKTQTEDLEHIEEDALQALDTLEKTLMSPLVLSLLKHIRNYFLDIDACDKNRVCSPTGQETREVTPTCWISFMSPSPSINISGYYPPVRSRSSLERSVITTVLKGARFALRTDHHALRWN